tara:strand:+ start:123 stop:365 length:243 start_codon:yes stop_codon:yes gene_type:complete
MKKTLLLSLALFFVVSTVTQTSAVCHLAKLTNSTNCVAEDNFECCAVEILKYNESCVVVYCADHDQCVWEEVIPMECKEN